MEYYNEQLMKLQQQIGQENRLTAQLKGLEQQQNVLEKKIWKLESQKFSEQADVDKLEQGSLFNFFYRVVGKMDEKLDKEKREALEAAVKYDTAVMELKAVKADIQKCQKELTPLRNSRLRYDRMLAEKVASIMNSGLPEAEQILKTEERLVYLEGQQKEIREAQTAGNRALSIADSILSSLDSAEGWGTWDLVGGGLVSDLAKHSHLDDAQRRVETLQIQLRQFRTELTDIQISADMQVNVDGFLRFADYFFDGIFVDWTVLDHISRAKEQITSTREKIKQVLYRLNSMQENLQQELDSETARRDTLILRVKM